LFQPRQLVVYVYPMGKWVSFRAVDRLHEVLDNMDDYLHEFGRRSVVAGRADGP